MSLGSKIKTLREQKDLSQRELAERTDISQATISRLEHNLMRQLKSDALGRIAAELHTTTDFLSGKDAAVSPEGIFRSDPVAREFLELYSSLNSKSKDAVKSFMNYLVTSESEDSNPA